MSLGNFFVAPNDSFTGLEPRSQFVLVEWLAKIIVRSNFKTLEHIALLIIRTQQNRVHVPLLTRPNSFAEFESAAPRHQAVQDSHPGRIVAIEDALRFIAIGGKHNFVAPGRKQSLQHIAIEASRLQRGFSPIFPQATDDIDSGPFGKCESNHRANRRKRALGDALTTSSHAEPRAVPCTPIRRKKSSLELRHAAGRQRPDRGRGLRLLPSPRVWKSRHHRP